MLRQSLGSPSSKVVKDEQLLLSESQLSEECKAEEEEEEVKKLKPKTAMPPGTYIHLIPMLTLLCFLILYLSSHDPADLGDFNSLSDPSDSELVEINKGDILAIRSLKNLKQEAETVKHRRLHRKIPQF